MTEPIRNGSLISAALAPERATKNANTRSLGLLLVQHHVAVARAWKRCLREFYDDVVVLHSPAEAQQRLAQEPVGRFDMVCGEWFGRDAQRGSHWLASATPWPALRRVVLASGEPPDRVPHGVVAIVRKPCGPLELLASLQPPRYRQARAA